MLNFFGFHGCPSDLCASEAQLKALVTIKERDDTYTCYYFLARDAQKAFQGH